MMQSDAERLKVLEQLEAGELDFDQALSELQGTGREPTQEIPEGSSAGAESAKPRWHLWWLIPFYFGAVATAAGILLAFQGGEWWFLATPLLLLGMGLLVVALASTQSPWLHVRITNPERSWPKTIGFSIPVPLRFAAWIVRMIGPFIPNMDEQALAEVLMAFELGRMMDEPLHVEFDDGDTGEHVELFLG